MTALQRYAIVGFSVATFLTTVIVAAPTESRYALVSAADKEGAPLVGLAADDFAIEEDGASCEVLGVTPAAYPIAVILDISSYARSDFQQLRDAVHQFVGALSGRDVALYTSGTPSTRVVDFTSDLRQLETAIGHTFAQPDGGSRAFDAIVEAAQNLRARRAAVTRIVVVSAGGPESSGRPPRDIVQAVIASRSIVDVVDLQQTRTRANPGDARASKSPMPAVRTDADAQLLRDLSRRTLGLYARIVSPSGYALSLQKIRGRLLSEVVVEYAAAPGAARNLRVGVRLPGAVVRGIAIGRAPSAP